MKTIRLRALSKSKWPPRKLVALVPALCLLGLLYWIWRAKHGPTLVELEKQVVIAKSEDERNRVIERLERYYMTLPVTREIHESVDRQLQKRLAALEANCLVGGDPEPTSYQLESQLECLLRRARMNLAQDQLAEFQEAMKQATQLAQTLDETLHSRYWSSLVTAAKGLTKGQALSWLRAEVAQQLCWDNMPNSDRWHEAEQYGVLAFQLSKDCSDERLRLDIRQWLGYILDEYYALYDLCIVWAESRLELANAIGYDLRSLGATYYEALALLHAGQSERALNALKRVVEMSHAFQGLRLAESYRKKATIDLAMAYRHLGQYKAALALYTQMAQTDQEPRDEILVHFNKGTLLGDLSDYEGAESEFSSALELARAAKDHVNEGKLIEHLGNLFFLLSEYQRALEYYKTADSLYSEVVSSNKELKAIVQILMAETFEKLDQPSVAEQKLQAASRIIEAGGSPWRKASLFNTLGETYLKLNREKEALQCFRQSLELCEQSGLVRLGWQAQLNLAHTLVRMGQHDDARKLTSAVLSLARESSDVERVLESLALLAQIEAAKGNRGTAIEISDDVVHRIEQLIGGMRNENRLISVHQKMYEYLKQAVTFELENQDPRKAFLKLDYVKALWRGRSSAQRGSCTRSRVDDPAELEVLRQRLTGSHKLVIHYFLTKHELCAFLMGETGLTLLRKPMSADLLRSRVDAYKKAIEDTAPLLRDFQPGRVESHYLKTCQLGSQLFEDLMGWPELRLKLEQTETLYVIPDEFLYEVPFATLVVSTQGGERAFLAEKMCVVSAPSAFVCDSGQQPSEGLQVRRTLASADPSFPRAEDLLDMIKRRLRPVEELETQNDDADKGEILRRLNQGYQVYVLFGHGMANAVYPELSSMELSVKNPAHTSSRKVTLSVEDLQKVDWSSAELVLLVGCDTAGGRLYRGSGISSLQQSFLTSGARAVVASQWKIDAAVAVTQLKFFLDAWIRTSNPSRAFHEFQKASITSLAQNSFYRNPHPYLWGSYTLAIKN